MPQAADQPAKPLRTWRPMALWTLGILLAALGVLVQYGCNGRSYSGMPISEREVAIQQDVVLLGVPGERGGRVVLPPLLPGPCTDNIELFKTGAGQRLLEGGSLSVPYLIKAFEDPRFDEIATGPRPLASRDEAAWRVHMRIPPILAAIGDYRAVAPLMRDAAKIIYCDPTLDALGKLDGDERVPRFAVQIAWERLFLPRLPDCDGVHLEQSVRLIGALSRGDHPVPAEDALPFLAAYSERFEEGRRGNWDDHVTSIAASYGKEGVSVLVLLALTGLPNKCRSDYVGVVGWQLPKDENERIRFEYGDWKASMGLNAVRRLGKLRGHRDWEEANAYPASLAARQGLKAQVQRWWTDNGSMYPADLLDRAWDCKLTGIKLAEWEALPLQKRWQMLESEAKKHNLNFEDWKKANNYVKAKMLRERHLLPESRNCVVTFPASIKL